MNTEKCGNKITMVRLLMKLMGRNQRAALYDGLAGEERAAFVDIVLNLERVWNTMPATYETEEVPTAEKVCQLHYFMGGADWWIIEKDSDPDGEGQIQAFGIADLGCGPEFGYISIPELTGAGVELDFYWSPVTAGTILERAQKASA
jgi:hypothetical protein